MKKEEIGIGILSVGIVIFFVVMFGAFMGFDKVDANHLGVKVKFGEVIGHMEAGLQWTGLFVDVVQYDLRLRKEVIDLTGANSAVDKTGQSVFATINVNYKVIPKSDTVIGLFKEVGPDGVIADRLNIQAIIREGFKQATVKYDALEILEKRQKVKKEAKEFIEANFPSKYFKIEDIVITNIDFSENFKSAIEAKKTAEQEALKEQNQLEVVKFQQQQEIEKYKAEAEKLRLQKSQVTDLLNQQKWIEKWDGRLPQYMISSDSTANTLLNLPIVKSGEGG